MSKLFLIILCLLLIGCEKSKTIGTILKHNDPLVVTTKTGSVTNYSLLIVTTNRIWVSVEAYLFYKDGDRYLHEK